MKDSKDYAFISSLSLAAGMMLILISLHAKLPFDLKPTNTPFILLGLILLSNFAFYALSLLKNRPALQLSRYVTVGLFNTVLDTATVNLLAFLSGRYDGVVVVLFNAFSFFSTTTVSYLLNRRWVFETGSRGSRNELLKFMAATSGSLAINSALVFILTTITGPLFQINEALWLTLVKLLTAAVAMVWNFLAYKFFVFNKNRLP